MTVLHCVSCGWTEEPSGFKSGLGAEAVHTETARRLLEALFDRRTTCPECGYMVLIEVEK